MYLAYLDDSGTKDKSKRFQVMTAVILHDSKFTELEVVMAAAIEGLVAPEKLGDFQEFHAFELYLGRGPFEGVDEIKRHSRITPSSLIC